LGQAARVWARIGLLSFGGPAGQIALMHREIVAERGWVGERRFLHALSFCALLPGPEAQQLATYLGWLMHGVPGGVVAGGLFILPGAAVLLGLSILYLELGQVPTVAGVFLGLQCAVLAIVFQAVRRLASRALQTTAARGLAVAAFVALAGFAVPFPVVVASAAILGACLPARFAATTHGAAGPDMPGLFDRALAAEPGLSRARASAARLAGGVALTLWLLPVAALHWLLPGRFAAIALFFCKMAVVTFGGAYAVLAYVAQDAVHGQHWLTAGEMLSGLGLAETTPGPLILVLQFVGFLAGARAPGGLSGLAGGIAGSVLTLWVSFVPCFAYVFLGAPAMERLAANRVLAAALAGVSASVVGIIANLGFWFGEHVLFGANLGNPQPVSMALALLAAICVFVLRLGAAVTLGICAVVGLVVSVS
jgi:chromate transporter